MLREFFSFNLNWNECSWNDKFWLSSPEYIRDIFSPTEQNSPDKLIEKEALAKAG